MYEGRHRITYYDLDMAGQVKMSALLRMVHIAADADANGTGIGFTAMSRAKMTFVLQRFSLGIFRMPAYNENVTLRTWPHSVTPATFFRQGDMHDESGAKIMEWTSLWVLFDIAARRILKPKAISAVSPTFLGLATGEDFGVSIRPRKLVLPEAAEISRYTHHVRYCEVDTNNHMNNSIYGDLINNALGGSDCGAWREVQINYIAETRLGDEIDVTALRDGKIFYVKGAAGGRMSFAAEIVT